MCFGVRKLVYSLCSTRVVNQPTSRRSAGVAFEVTTELGNSRSGRPRELRFGGGQAPSLSCDNPFDGRELPK